MKNLKKLLSLGMAFALSASFVPNVLATNEADTLTIPGEEVLYYNTFPTGTNADLPEVEHELYYFYGRNDNLRNALNVTHEYSHALNDSCASIKGGGYKMTLEDLDPVTFNGDTGVRVASRCSIASGPIVMLDFRYKDSDKTPTENGALKNGMYKLSFDFVLDGSVSKNDGFRVEANCMHGNCGNSFTWMMNNTWHNLSGGNTWNYTEKDIPITNNELHHYEIIFDLDSDKVMTFMDGVKKKDTKFTGNINFLHATIGGKMKYVDNMLFTKMDSLYAPDMTAEVLENNENGLTLKFSDFIGDMSGLSNITYTNKMTGEVIKTTSMGVADSQNTIKITPEKELSYGYTYTLNADVEVPGLRGGGSLVIETQDVTVGVVKNISVIDYNGQENMLSNNIPANTDSFVFEFESGEVAEDILSNLAIYDNLGNPVEIKTEATDELNVAKVNIVKNLKGDTNYSVILNGFENPYNWNFKTGKGGFTVKPIKFYKADGETPVALSDVKVGDTVKAKYEIVNTGKSTEDLSFALTMGLYSKNGLIDFNYENVELKDGADYYETTVDFTVSRTEDLKAKGFIWETINTRKPLFDSVVTK